jgi:hypothetical protein
VVVSGALAEGTTRRNQEMLRKIFILIGLVWLVHKFKGGSDETA